MLLYKNMMNPYADLGMTFDQPAIQPGMHEAGHRAPTKKPDPWKKKMAGALGDIGQLFGNMDTQMPAAPMPQMQNFGILDDPVRQPMQMPSLMAQDPLIKQRMGYR